MHKSKGHSSLSSRSVEGNSLRVGRGAERKPIGQPTRGKTAPNRLRRVDNFVARYDAPLLRREDGDFADALAVDLGFGAEAVTTVEMARRFHRINPNLRLLGVEIDPERVAAAQPFADERTRFCLGGFNLPLQRQSDGVRERVRFVRAFNVLRQYDEPAVHAAWSRLALQMLPGALLVDGTSDPLGRVWVANLLRRTEAGAPDDPLAAPGLKLEALVFSTSFRIRFDPVIFPPVLPKNLIHRMIPGEAIYAFFADWNQVARVTSPLSAWGQRQWFAAAAQELALRGWKVDTRLRWLRSGYLILRSLVNEGQ